MPILPNGEFILRCECEGRRESAINIAKAIADGAKARGIDVERASELAAPYVADWKMYEKALSQ